MIYSCTHFTSELQKMMGKMKNNKLNTNFNFKMNDYLNHKNFFEYY